MQQDKITGLKLEGNHLVSQSASQPGSQSASHADTVCVAMAVDAWTDRGVFGEMTRIEQDRECTGQ